MGNKMNKQEEKEFYAKHYPKWIKCCQFCGGYFRLPDAPREVLGYYPFQLFEQSSFDERGYCENCSAVMENRSYQR